MENQNGFFIKLGEDSENAPVLRYSIREPISYFFKNIITRDFPDGYFDMNKMPAKRRSEDETEEAKVLVRDTENPKETLEALKNQEKLAAAAEKVSGILGDGETELQTEISKENFYMKLTGNPQDIVATKTSAGRPLYFTQRDAANTNGSSARDLYIKSGSQLYFTERLYRFDGVKVAKPKKIIVRPQLLIVESYQLSNYRGNYGAGAVIKTHSLAPGEKNRFSIKTYEKTTEKENEGSSILDSNTREASSDFEESFERERSNKLDTLTADLKTSEHAEAEAGAFGIGASGKYDKTGEWGSKDVREQFAKTVGKAVTKHSYKASSKRDIEINFSKEVTTETGLETAIEREIENINVSRTLNLVFRQMIQEFFSVLHLIDIKLSIYDGTQGPYQEYSISEIDQMLEDYFVNNNVIRDEVKTGILRELYYVFDYQDSLVQFLEKVDFTIPDDTPAELKFENTLPYWRVKKDLKTEIADLPGVKIPGVVTNVTKITMRTDGVILDAFLGLGEGLDAYSKGLQMESVREKSLENDKIKAALEILSSLSDEEKAEAFEKMFNQKVVCCGNERITQT